MSFTSQKWKIFIENKIRWHGGLDLDGWARAMMDGV
jgi:hypothetical protein